MKKNKLIYILGCLVIIVGLLAIPLFSHNGGNDEGGAGGESDRTETAAEEPVTIEIACVGDVMAHSTQIRAAEQADGTYSFAEPLSQIAPYIEEADLALCNVETTFGGEPYTGYPAFSSPDALSDDLFNAGFDIAITANNHMNDRGAAGITRTLEVLKASGFETVGSTINAGEPRYAMVNVKGVNIAVIAYTYETGAAGSGTMLNGSSVSADAASRINSFNYNTLDEDLAEIAGVANEAREAGADIVIMYYHWGEEYQLSANTWQKTIAERTVNEIGVDAIFASHPHNLQEAELVNGVPVFYSLGNFISNQRAETLGDDKKYTETGAIGKVTIEYNKKDDAVTSVSMSALPIWVDRYKSNGKTAYMIIPLDDTLDGNSVLAASGHLERAKGALSDAKGILKID